MLVYQRVSQILCTIHSSIPYRPRLHHRRHANFRTSVATPSRSPMDKGTSRILKWRVLDPHKSQKKYEKISKIGHQTISNSSNISQISKSSNRPAVTIKVMMRVWLPHRQPQWQSTTSQHVPGIPDGSARLVAPSRTSRRCSSCTSRRWRKRPSHCYLQKSPEKSWRNDTNFDPGSSDTKGHLSTWLAPNGFSRLKTCCHGCHGCHGFVRSNRRFEAWRRCIPCCCRPQRILSAISPGISPGAISTMFFRPATQRTWVGKWRRCLPHMACSTCSTCSTCSLSSLRSHQPRHIWNFRIWIEYDEYRNGGRMFVRSRQICFPFFSLQVGKGIPVDSSLAHVPRATDVEDEARCDEAHGRCLAKCRHQRKKRHQR